ncbi:MAG TPA: PAS domain S-box protein [Syntrophales bacterium]|nr:PAS domain S-box protein [Syntrophales bacterium]
MESELQESEETYRLLFESAGEGILIAQGEQIKFANPALVKILGYTEDIITARPFVSFIHPEDREMVLDRHLRRMRGESVETDYPFRIVTSDGNEKWLLVNSTVISWDGKPASLSFLMDITDRKQAEAMLRESEERYRSIIEKSYDAFYRTDEHGVVIMVSPSILRMLGYDSLDEILGKPIENFWVHPEERDKMLWCIAEDGFIRDYEITAKKKDGSSFPTAVTSSFRMSNEGKILGVEGVIRDISKRKKAEEMLRDSEERFRAFMDNMRSLVIIKDKELRPLFFNRRYMEMFPGEEWLGKTPEEIFPPKIAGPMREKDLKALSEGFVSYEEEWTDKDGNSCFFETRKFSISQKGKVSLLGAIITDITERKQAFENLKRSEQDYRLLFENANDTIVIVQDNHLKFSNPRITSLLGYTLNELLDVPFINLVHPADRSMVMDTHQNRMEGQSVPEYYCFRVTKKQGKTRWVEANAVVVDWKGRPAALAFLRDITERKQVEKQLKKHHDHLENVVKERAEINEQLRLELVKRKRAESALKERSKDLKKHVDKLVELNSALKFLLKQREEDKGQLEEKVILNVKELLLPYLEELKKSQLDAKHKNLVSIIESNLNEIISPFAHKLSSNYYGLTPREIEIANLVRQGKSSKEIANIIGISDGSIIVHRNHIRKKLGIISKKINLRTYLASLS